MLRETVSRFAEEKIGPKVAEMDQNHKVDGEVMKGMFEQGLMGIEIPEKYGGGGMSFFDSIIAIEEIAKVDAFVFFCFLFFFFFFFFFFPLLLIFHLIIPTPSSSLPPTQWSRRNLRRPKHPH